MRPIRAFTVLDELFQLANEHAFYDSFDNVGVLRHKYQLESICDLWVFLNHQLFERARLVLTLEQPVHREVRQVDQIDGLAVSLHKEGECTHIKAWQRNQVRALSLVLHRAVNLDERALLFVDEANPWYTPASNGELVRGDFNQLSDQVVHEQEICCNGKLLPCRIVLGKVETSGAC